MIIILSKYEWARCERQPPQLAPNNIPSRWGGQIARTTVILIMIITHSISLNLPSGRVRPANDDSRQSSSRVVLSLRTSDTQLPEHSYSPCRPRSFRSISMWLTQSRSPPQCKMMKMICDSIAGHSGEFPIAQTCKRHLSGQSNLRDLSCK